MAGAFVSGKPRKSPPDFGNTMTKKKTVTVNLDITFWFAGVKERINVQWGCVHKDKDAVLWFDLEYSYLFQIQMHLREKKWCDIVANCWWIWWTVMRFWNAYFFSTHLNSLLCKWMNLFMNFMSKYCENRGKKEQIECFVWKLIKMSWLFGKENYYRGGEWSLEDETLLSKAKYRKIKLCKQSNWFIKYENLDHTFFFAFWMDKPKWSPFKGNIDFVRLKFTVQLTFVDLLSLSNWIFLRKN